MIIFYQKSTGKIIGVINGRVHDKNTLEKVMIKPGNIPDNDIGKYIVPFVNNNSKELLPDVPFSDLILDFENGKKNIYDYKFNLDNNELLKIDLI